MIRRLLAASGIVIAVLVVLATQWRDDFGPAEDPGPTSVAAPPMEEALAPAAAATGRAPEDDSERAPALAVLSPYDSNPDPARSMQLPEDSPETLIPALLARVADGDHAAADELFIYTWRCGPHQPVPRDAEQLEQHRERIIQTRQTTSGRIINDWEAALDELEVLYRLCRYLDEQGVAPHTHWVEVAAELGSLEAMTRYWSVQQSAFDLADSRPTPAEYEAMHARAAGYLEQARDTGYVDAFVAIAILKGGFIPGPYEQGGDVAFPYELDGVGALAHFYASLELRTALIQQRQSSRFYDDRRWLENMDRAALANVERLIRQMELRVDVWQHREARELAERLISRCCR